MSNSLSSIAHRAICPERSSLYIVLLRGRLVSIVLGCAWKQGQSFFSSYLESRCCLLEKSISGFCLGQGLAYKEYGFLLSGLVFFE